MSKRLSNFELMRIVAMIMVVLGHCVLYTAQDTEPYLGKLDITGWMIKSFTIVAVNCYFILTGYFAKSDYVRFKSIIILWIKTIIYSVVIYSFFLFLKIVVFDARSMLNYLFPVMTKQYWFIQTYIVVSMIAPFLCKMVDNLNKHEHLFVMIVIIIFFSLHQTFIPIAKTLDTTQGYGIISACMLFIIGRWLKKYGDEYISRINTICWFFLYILVSIMIFCTNYLIVRFSIAGGLASRGNFYAYNSITVVASSVCLFCFFMTLKMKNDDYIFINYLGRNCVAAYLITGHPLLIGYLWTDIFRIQKYSYNTIVYVLTALFLSTISLFACVVIDKCLDNIMNRTLLTDKVNRIDKELNKFIFMSINK